MTPGFERPICYLLDQKQKQLLFKYNIAVAILFSSTPSLELDLFRFVCIGSVCRPDIVDRNKDILGVGTQFGYVYDVAFGASYLAATSIRSCRPWLGLGLI